MSRASLAKCVGLYLGLALLLCYPAPFSGELIGNPDIDVWNHAWGYFYWLDALGQGSLPWSTSLLYGPEGGVLYFVDPLGAAASLPFSALFGVGFAYNLIQIFRFALAGLISHLFCRAVTGDGPHCWAAGVAFATTPYLLAEQGNGISEVGAVGWIPLVFWMAFRAFESNARRDWILLGIAQGFCSVASFYYGLTCGILVGLWWLLTFRRERLGGTFLAAVISLALALPAFLLFRASLWPQNARGIIRRSVDLNRELMAHNAVDPREYFFPGNFESVDLLGVYGEHFIHTGFLRLSVLFLAILAIRRVGKAIRPWLIMAVVSLVLGLGPALWWGGDFVGPGEGLILLPFGWLQEVLPQLAITHPSRLSIGAQAILALLVGWALVGRSRRIIVSVCVVMVAESLFLSSAQWPLPRASSAIPDLYEEIRETEDRRGVLDLPAEVGTTMASSQYFWFQTLHKKAVPYAPDARSGSSADRLVFRWLQHASGPVAAKRPAFVDESVNQQELRRHLKQRYGWIVLHEDLAERAGVRVLFGEALEGLLGPPSRSEGLLYWRL